jgi:predicted aspartyl protease
MGHVYATVTLTNYREALQARLGQFDPAQVHTLTTEALIDTGATHCVIPLALAERLALVLLSEIPVAYANGTHEAVPESEVVTIGLMGREAKKPMLVMGCQVLLGVTVLEEMDLVADTVRGQLMPNLGTRDQPLFRV